MSNCFSLAPGFSPVSARPATPKPFQRFWPDQQAVETACTVHLARYDVLDTPPEPSFDDLTMLAAHICGTPIALVSLVDADRQFFKSHFGLDASETPRKVSFCAHAIHEPELFIVPDALADERFADNPLVTAEPNIRFYAGAPLRTEDDFALGTLCVIDRVPRTLSPQQQEALRALGRLVVSRLELRRTETALRKSDAFQKAILAGADCSIISTTADGIITTFNAAAERMLGYTAGEVIGRKTPVPIHDADEVKRRAEELSAELGRRIEPGFEVFVAKSRGGQPEEREWTYVRKDGSRFPVLLSVTGLCDGAGQPIGFLGVARDITERKRQEESLRRAKETTDIANADLARANRLKDEFLANMSHELRTPLNAILGMSEALLEQVSGPLNEKQARSLNVVHESGAHLLALINDILALSKIEAGKLELHFEPVNIESVCQASLRLVKEAALRKRLNLDFTPACGRAVIRADERRLKQILVNLLSNAVKFTHDGGHVSLDVALERERGTVNFTVADSGIGIAPEDLEKLFKPFTQLDSGLARRHEGTGLGLVLVWKLAELHGGSVSVQSEPGKGARFTVTLPLRPGDDAAEKELHPATSATKMAGPPAATTTSKGPAPFVLLAEDNEATIETFREYLEAKGYRVGVARQGVEAIAQAQAHQPALILMDVQMPGMDGLEAIRRIRADDALKSTPIIALTALAMTGDRERCFAAGADEYLSKPVPLRALAERIAALVKR